MLCQTIPSKALPSSQQRTPISPSILLRLITVEQWSSWPQRLLKIQSHKPMECCNPPLPRRSTEATFEKCICRQERGGYRSRFHCQDISPPQPTQDSEFFQVVDAFIFPLAPSSQGNCTKRQCQPRREGCPYPSAPCFSTSSP